MELSSKISSLINDLLTEWEGQAGRYVRIEHSQVSAL